MGFSPQRRLQPASVCFSFHGLLSQRIFIVTRSPPPFSRLTEPNKAQPQTNTAAAENLSYFASPASIRVVLQPPPEAHPATSICIDAENQPPNPQFADQSPTSDNDPATPSPPARPSPSARLKPQLSKSRKRWLLREIPSIAWLHQPHSGDQSKSPNRAAHSPPFLTNTSLIAEPVALAPEPLCGR